MQNRVIDDVGAHKHSDRVKQFYLVSVTNSLYLSIQSVKHAPSAKKALRVLTGKGNFGKKKDNKKFSEDYLFIFPSERTLSNYEVPGYYGFPPDLGLVCRILN